MAIYHLHIKPISRSAGRSAVAAAAYRAGERLRDERTGALHNYSARRDVTHKEIVLPAGSDPAALAWAADRAHLWNTAESVEVRRDARSAREYEINLPAELSAPQRLRLAQTFAHELADRHRVAVDLTLHDPRPKGDPRNYHAHLLATTRELLGSGLGAKSGLDMSSALRQRLGLVPGLVELYTIRERWAVLANEALAAAGLEARVDHRSYAARGIDREPRPRLPWAALQAERNGERSDTADYLRARYHARVQAREARQQALQVEHETTGPDDGRAVAQGRGLEELRRRAREAWLQMRRAALGQTASRPLQHDVPARQRTAPGSQADHGPRSQAADRDRAPDQEHEHTDPGLSL